jgi:hypothetical protein
MKANAGFGDCSEVDYVLRVPSSCPLPGSNGQTLKPGMLALLFIFGEGSVASDREGAR